MRKIKLRGYFEIYKKIYEVTMIDWSNDLVWLKFYDEHREEFYDSEEYLKNVSIMQHTGLRDKEKTEVYEEDFLSNGTTIWQVKFNQENCCFEAVEQNVLKEKWDIKAVLTGISMEAGIVIGNSYENPKLLEVG